MKQWQISELEQKEMEDVNYKKLLFPWQWGGVLRKRRVYRLFLQV